MIAYEIRMVSGKAMDGKGNVIFVLMTLLYAKRGGGVSHHSPTIYEGAMNDQRDLAPLGLLCSPENEMRGMRGAFQGIFRDSAKCGQTSSSQVRRVR